MSSLIIKAKDAIASGNTAEMAKAFKAIVDTDGIQSESAHQLAVLIENHRLPFIDFLIFYIRSNQNIISSAQLRVAESFAEQGKVDEATIEAREFLRKLLNWSSFKDGTAGDGFKNLASRAHLVMTAVYTTAGARSYSLRLLDRGISFATTDASRAFLENEVKTIKKELETSGNATLDQKWEEFFASGANASALIKHCLQLGMATLAKRVELLEAQFRFDANFRMTQEESLLEVFTIRPKDQSGKDTYVLN